MFIRHIKFESKYISEFCLELWKSDMHAIGFVVLTWKIDTYI
jgi:hypothetical protein